MEEEKSSAFLDPKYILGLVVYRKWIILISLLLSGIVGIAVAVITEKTYSASTLILVQPQRVPSAYVQSLVTVDIESRINSLSQEILSRTNLEKIIAQFNLYSGPDFQDMFMEDKVERLKSRINVEVTRDRRGRGANAESFSIAFRGPDPKQVKDITNTLASFFINENFRLRESQARGTSTFLDEELESMRTRLENTEKALKKYRQTYMGSLPEQLGTNLSIIERLQEDLSQRQANLRDAKSRLLTLSNMASAGYDSTTTNSPNGNEAGMSLESMRAELERLRGRYTEKHPDILRLKQTIAEAEKAGTSTGGVRREPPAVIEIRREIAGIEASIQHIRQEMAVYNERVESTPQREQELNALQRDYENMQASYQSLLNRKLEAEIAVNMERKQKGEQFRVLDPARLPQRPTQPNMPQLLLFSIAAGIGLGGGGIFLLEYLSNAIHQPKEIETLLGLPVLATLPVIQDPKQKLYELVNTILAWITGTLAFFVYVSFAAIVIIGEKNLMGLLPRFY